MDKILLDVLPLLATVFLTICYFPQIYRIHKTKDVSSMSLSFWIILNLALTCLLINAFVIFVKFGTYGYLITEILNEGLALTVLVQVIKYRKKDNLTGKAQ
jgi:uncharacterized protein with PQ loop repeat